MERADRIVVAFAGPGDVASAAEVLAEGAAWMAHKGWPGWSAQDVAPEFVAQKAAAGELVAARVDDELAGVCTLSRSDPEFWPEDLLGEAAYLHRLAVRRRFAGGQTTSALVAWCARTALGWGCPALKLDCHPTSAAFISDWASHAWTAARRTRRTRGLIS